MRRLVDQALNDETFVRKIIDIVRAAPAFDDLAEARAIYDWFKRNIRFTRDPVTKEKLYPPAELLKIRAGDCDDISLGIGASLLAVGIPARWSTISTAAEAPAEFTHVFVEAEIPPRSGNWIALDAARLDAEFGVEPPTYFRKRVWDIASDHYEDLQGNVRRRPRFLSGYVGLGRGLGQDDGSINWGSILQQTVAETPALITAASGRPGSASSPYGSVSVASNPYAYPTYGIPAAGYTATGYPLTTTAGLSMSPITLMLIAGGILLVMMAKRGS
jgi:hypothetical protein